MVKVITEIFPKETFFEMSPEDRLYHIKIFQLKRLIDALPKKNIRAKAKKKERARLLGVIAAKVAENVREEDKFTYTDYLEEHKQNQENIDD